MTGMPEELSRAGVAGLSERACDQRIVRDVEAEAVGQRQHRLDIGQHFVAGTPAGRRDVEGGVAGPGQAAVGAHRIDEGVAPAVVERGGERHLFDRRELARNVERFYIAVELQPGDRAVGGLEQRRHPAHQVVEGGDARLQRSLGAARNAVEALARIFFGGANGAGVQAGRHQRRKRHARAPKQEARRASAGHRAAHAAHAARDRLRHVHPLVAGRRAPPPSLIASILFIGVNKPCPCYKFSSGNENVGCAMRIRREGKAEGC